MRSKLTVGVIVLVVLLLSMDSIVRLITEWQWFTSLGFLELFIRPTLIQAAVFVVALLVGTVFIYVNLSLLTRHLITPREQVNLYESRYAILLDKLQSIGRWFKLGLSAAIGLLWAGIFADFWQEAVFFFAGEPTGVQEPVYQLDTSFYLFQLPFYQQIVGALLSLFLFTFLAALVIYFLRGLISWQQVKGLQVVPGAQGALRHLNALFAVLMLLLAVNAFLNRYELLFSDQGAVYGAGFTDIYVTQYLYLGLALIGLAAFVVSLIQLKKPRLKLSVGFIAVFIFVSVAGAVAGQIVQATIVSPNELTRERPYIENHLEMTRSAYNLDEITEQTWELEEEYEEAFDEEEMEDIVDEEEDIPEDMPEEIEVDRMPEPDLDPEVLNNMRLLDYRPLLDTYREAQEYRRYYHFSDVDIARYWMDGEYHQVMLSAREMDVERLPSEAQTAVNRHLKYTHGYGLAMSPVGRFTEDGMPEYYIRDMPVQDDLGLDIERPELYFGELTNDFVMVNTDVNEFHYPGQEDVAIEYQADKGVNMNFLNRILFAIRERSGLVLFSGEYSAESQILVRRNIQDRVERIAPFLTYDQDPYLAVADNQLYWIIDAYVTSENFPYSRPFDGTRNYIENPVKVVVNAYSGEVDYYLVEDDEPFTRALDRAFPDLFSDPEEASEEIRTQFRYPHPYFSIQAEMLQNYHMTNPVVFYNREDAWDFPMESYHGTSIEMEPYYATLKLPDGEGPEFVLMMPYTPVERNNMVAWLGARSDGENYGEKVLFRFPAGSLVYGPQQVDARIDQQPEISEQLSLWDGQGSSVIRGNMLVIPLEEGVMYIEPLYLQAEDAAFPELRRVIAAWGDRVVMESTLEDALAAFDTRVAGEDILAEVEFDRDPDEDVGVVGPDEDEVEPEEMEIIEEEFATIRELVDEILALEQESKEALQAGDWARYGELQEEREELLERLDENVDAPVED